MTYKLITDNNDLILSESLHGLIATRLFDEGIEEFDLYLTEEGLVITCERKPDDMPELGIKFEEIE